MDGDRNDIVRPPFRLVPGIASTDTIAVLTELLERANAGEILGIALVALSKPKSYEFELTGEAARSPTFALGTVTRLAHHIERQILDN